MLSINNIRANHSEGKIIAFSLAIAILLLAICQCRKA